MINESESRNLSTAELFSLALCAEEFNIRFFNDWANRMRAFDPELVDLLYALSRDARQFRRMLNATSQRLFTDALPELDDELRRAVARDIDLPERRYFVVSDEEAKHVLSAALSLQKNSIRLLNSIDEALRTHGRDGLLESASQAAISADPAGSVSLGGELQAEPPRSATSQ